MDGRCAESLASFRPTPFTKRAFDVIGSISLLIVMAPLLIVVAATIKVVSRGPIFFRHTRVGAEGREFSMWKFRTLHTNANPEEHRAYVEKLHQTGAPLHKLDNVANYIPLGKFFRRTCIDELPQLINVLCGEMSLVGPRPDVLSLESYEHWQKKRFEVVPGMTGYWQVNGKNSATATEMVEMDIYYVENRSLRLDLEILAQTAGAILRKSPKDD